MLALIFLFFSCVQCYNFKSDVEIISNNAILKAMVKYSSEEKLIIYEYSSPIKMTEIRDYKENIKYKYCSKCESYYLNGDFPTVQFMRFNDKVEEFIFYDSADIYKVINFTENIESSEFDYSYMSCPQPVCKRVVDIVLILDESGSIAEMEWEQLLDFCVNIVKSYDIGLDAAQFAIVGFAGFGRLHLDLTFRKETIIDKLNDLRYKQLRGGTCTGCGLMIAKNIFENHKIDYRTLHYNPEHLIITITDGEVSAPDYRICRKTTTTSYHNFCVGCCSREDPIRRTCWNNVNSPCFTNMTFKTINKDCSSQSVCKNGIYGYNGYFCSGCWCDSTCSYIVCDNCKLNNYAKRCAEYKYGVEACEYAYGGYINPLNNFTDSCKEIKKDARLTSIAIGVGEYDEKQLKEIASTVQGMQTVFKLSDFSSLNNILNQLITESCSKVELKNDCNSDCLGFCGCDKKCYCPECIKFNESCVINECNVDSNNIVSTGCVIKEKECKNNKCQIMTKNNNTKDCCIYQDIICNDHTICTKDLCDPDIGCIFKEDKEIYDDNNSCTIDKCENNKITNTLIDFCNPPDLCHIIDQPCVSVSFTYCQPAIFKEKCKCNNTCDIPKCDIETGVCSCEPINCDVSDSCLIGYCLDGKCLVKDNITKLNECHSLYKSDCSYGICSKGECLKVDIKCSECQKNKTFIEECERKNNKCQSYKCQDINGRAECVKYWEMPISDDKCLNEYCDPLEGIKYNKKEDYQEDCKYYKCINGTYEITNLCRENDKCMNYLCINETCFYNSICPQYETINGKENKCRILKDCDTSLGCIYEELICETGLCYNSYCLPETGECVNIDNSSNCINEFDLCSVFECNEYLGCITKDKECKEDNPCYNYYCDNDTGDCIKEEKCKSFDPCVNVFCSLNGDCLYEEIKCNESNNTCFVNVCKNGTCVSKFKSESFVDVCGYCVNEYGNYYNKSDALCVGALSRGEFGAVIGAAAIAGIAVTAVIVAAVIGVSSTLGVKELINRAKIFNDSAVNNNPLYEGNDNEFDNMAYIGDD